MCYFTLNIRPLFSNIKLFLEQKWAFSHNYHSESHHVLPCRRFASGVMKMSSVACRDTLVVASTRCTGSRRIFQLCKLLLVRPLARLIREIAPASNQQPAIGGHTYQQHWLTHQSRCIWYAFLTMCNVQTWDMIKLLYAEHTDMQQRRELAHRHHILDKSMRLASRLQWHTRGGAGGRAAIFHAITCSRYHLRRSPGTMRLPRH